LILDIFTYVFFRTVRWRSCTSRRAPKEGRLLVGRVHDDPRAVLIVGGHFGAEQAMVCAGGETIVLSLAMLGRQNVIIPKQTSLCITRLLPLQRAQAGILCGLGVEDWAEDAISDAAGAPVCEMTSIAMVVYLGQSVFMV
jgi:hypothetical protein